MEDFVPVRKLWQRRVMVGLGVYGVLFFAAKNLTEFDLLIQESASPSLISLCIFSLAWIALLVVFFLILLRRQLKVEWRVLYMYTSMMALIGPVGEIFINAVYRHLFGGGTSLWTYVVYPIHGGDTSLYSALFIWPYYGVYLYFLHQKLNLSTESKRYYIEPASWMAFDAITLEFLVNVSSLVFLGTFIFYYFPNDVAHLTTIVAVPFYFLGGIVVTRTIKRFIVDPVFFGTMSLLIAFVVVFLTG